MSVHKLANLRFQTVLFIKLELSLGSFLLIIYLDITSIAKVETLATFPTSTLKVFHLHRSSFSVYSNMGLPSNMDNGSTTNTKLSLSLQNHCQDIRNLKYSYCAYGIVICT